MSMLALRAAERESLYVERRMESALITEVDMAAQSVERLILDATDSLRRDSSNPDWGSNPLAGTMFDLTSGHLEIRGSRTDSLNFQENFGGFLSNGARLPTYDLVTSVYAPMPQSEPGGGIYRQRVNALMETDPETREDIFSQAENEGFKTHSRNVSPQMSKTLSQKQVPDVVAQSPSPELAEMDFASDAPSPLPRSRTVSKNSSFAEITSRSRDGLLPYITDYGLEILFWKRVSDASFTGCALRMDVLRGMIADAIPDIISEARILTVLDDAGNPIVAPDALSPPPDWSRPFVAREISPALPRWEAAAWLTDPEEIASRANYARMVVWVQVAILGSVIIIGSLVVIRTMSYEMRMASRKTTFVANVSHELKTPLTSIRLYAELLLSGKQRDEERKREYLRTMMSETDRLSRLVDNVLSFSRKKKEKFSSEKLSLYEIARETMSQLEPHLLKLGFSVSCSGDRDIAVLGDREALKQVIVNLVSNAEKYSGGAGEISVECLQSGKRAMISVADRGIGVAPGMAEKIFQEFVRGDDSLTSPVNGTGLGLSIARDIARRHGGDVTYAPREGNGSVFTLVLPLEEYGKPIWRGQDERKNISCRG
jgi:signal transduction histidine kinase